MDDKLSYELEFCSTRIFFSHLSFLFIFFLWHAGLSSPDLTFNISSKNGHFQRRSVKFSCFLFLSYRDPSSIENNAHRYICWDILNGKDCHNYLRFRFPGAPQRMWALQKLRTLMTAHFGPNINVNMLLSSPIDVADQEGQKGYNIVSMVDIEW